MILRKISLFQRTSQRSVQPSACKYNPLFLYFHMQSFIKWPSDSPRQFWQLSANFSTLSAVLFLSNLAFLFTLYDVLTVFHNFHSTIIFSLLLISSSQRFSPLRNALDVWNSGHITISVNQPRPCIALAMRTFSTIKHERVRCLLFTNGPRKVCSVLWN